MPTKPLGKLCPLIPDGIFWPVHSSQCKRSTASVRHYQLRRTRGSGGSEVTSLDEPTPGNDSSVIGVKSKKGNETLVSNASGSPGWCQNGVFSYGAPPLSPEKRRTSKHKQNTHWWDHIHNYHMFVVVFNFVHFSFSAVCSNRCQSTIAKCHALSQRLPFHHRRWSAFYAE